MTDTEPVNATDYPWPVHPAAELFPLLGDEAGNTGYRTCRADGLPLCEITSSTLSGYWYVTKFEFPAGDVVGLRRPVKASGVSAYLDHFEIPPGSAWASFPTKPQSEAPWFGSPQGGAEDRSVYLIQSVGGGLVKIGSAGSVTSRLEEIQRMSPVPLQVVAVIPGSYAIEHELHRRFAADRVHGEWFRPSEALFAAFKESL